MEAVTEVAVTIIAPLSEGEVHLLLDGLEMLIPLLDERGMETRNELVQKLSKSLPKEANHAEKRREDHPVG